MPKPKRVWDNCRHIGDVMKSDRKKLRVELVARDGVKYLNLREWYMQKTDTEWKPGYLGLGIPIMLPVNGKIEYPLADLIPLIQATIDQSADFEIEDEANAVYYTPPEKTK